MSSDTFIRLLKARVATRLTSSAPALALDAVGCDLSDLRLALPGTSPPDEEALTERLAERLREVANRRERGRGELVNLGDEVELDVVAYAGNRLIPFSCRNEWRADVEPDESLPGLYEGLVGVRVGASVAVPVRLPESFPVESLRGVQTQFSVVVRRAFEVEAIEDSPETWPARLGAADLDQALDALADELEEERAAEAEAELAEQLLDEVAARTELELPVTVVNREVEQAWRRLELPALQAHDVSTETLDDALAGWLADAATRTLAERRLRATAGLQWIARTRELEVEEGDRLALCEALAEAAGVSLEDFQKELNRRPQNAAGIDALALRLLAIDVTMAEART